MDITDQLLPKPESLVSEVTRNSLSPGEKEHVSAWYIINMRISRQFCITVQYNPKPFIVIENKREKGMLWSYVFEPLATMLQWHEYHLQQTYVEMPVSLIFEQFVPACFGVTGRRTVIISRSTAHNHLYPRMLALTAHLHVPFHLGGNFIIELTIIQVLDRLWTSI